MVNGQRDTQQSFVKRPAKCKGGSGLARARQSVILRRDSIDLYVPLVHGKPGEK